MMKGAKFNRQGWWSAFRQSMIERSEKIMEGWDAVQKNGDPQLMHFLVGLMTSANEAAIRHFEMEVILGGADAKTYLRKHMVIVSYEKIELSDEIMNKPTVLMSPTNQGSWEGADASGSGETCYYCPDYEHPATALEAIERARGNEPLKFRNFK